MSAPHFNILTTQELTIDLSRPAMQYAISRLVHPALLGQTDDVRCEIDNLVNLMHNLLERSEPEPGNLDLIGG
jgi:hypothetical protein